MDKYDGFLFGNGLTINLLNQLANHIPSKKRYLLNIDDFLRCFATNRLSDREKRKIFKLFYKKETLENLKYFEKLKTEIICYYEKNDANIEYYFGLALFQENCCEYDYQLLKTVFPFLYNIWYEILYQYLSSLKLENIVSNFSNSVNKTLYYPKNIYTTNFDKFADHLKPEHLHGSFVTPYKKYNELIFQKLNREEFLYKCIWGWNGIGKLTAIEQYCNIKGYEKYFDFSFFFNQEVHIKNLLVYGIGFQRSGYMEDLSIFNSKYEKPAIGGVVDEHILIRLQGLQTRNQLDCITFSCYSDSEMGYFKDIVQLHELKNVMFLKSTEFKFTAD